MDDGFEWFETFANLERTGRFSERTYKLDRMEELAEAAGRPEKAFRSIHLAGSKGKGSTAAFVASILESAGYKTGIYTSPHLQDYRERIALPGAFFDDRLLLEAMHKVRNSLAYRNKPGDPPTTFELLTLCAFLAFQEAGCQWGVIETGLGGRLDSTNIITPSASVLTPLELEHTDVLGSTLEEIASEKAGIIKPGIPVYMGMQDQKVERIFRQKAEETGSRFYSLRQELTGFITETRISGTSLSAEFRSGRTLDCTLSLAGRHQGENACLAALCIDSLSREGHIGEVSPQQTADGLSRARLPGRFEIMRADPPLILDSAHTPGSIRQTLQTLQEISPDRGICIFGAVSGKDIRGMANILAPAFRRIIISKPGVFKKSDPEETFRVFREIHPEIELEPEPSSALEKALKFSAGHLPVLVTGSFYMASEIRKLLRS